MFYCSINIRLPNPNPISVLLTGRLSPETGCIASVYRLCTIRANPLNSEYACTSEGYPLTPYRNFLVTITHRSRANKKPQNRVTIGFFSVTMIVSSLLIEIAPTIPICAESSC